MPENRSAGYLDRAPIWQRFRTRFGLVLERTVSNGFLRELSTQPRSHSFRRTAVAACTLRHPAFHSKGICDGNFKTALKMRIIRSAPTLGQSRAAVDMGPVALCVSLGLHAAP